MGAVWTLLELQLIKVFVFALALADEKIIFEGYIVICANSIEAAWVIK